MEFLEMYNFLKGIGKTKEEMDEMWNYCVKHGHPLISMLNKCGKSWTDCNTSALSTLEREYLKLWNKDHKEGN